MLFIIGWLLLSGYLGTQGYTLWGKIVFWGGAVIIALCAVSGISESRKARENQQHFWAHYYDRDRVEAQKRGLERTPPPQLHDEVDTYIMLDAIFDDDD